MKVTLTLLLVVVRKEKSSRVIAEQNMFLNGRIVITQVFNLSEFKMAFNFVILGDIAVIPLKFKNNARTLERWNYGII